ncbi:hypothetical protein TNCV_2218531 [Trichonephila clavipes]|nr:hypothetical protein TNCV_2218531 [Trichonephila clavipes]
MRAGAYCAHPSIRYHWALRCMSRCTDQVNCSSHQVSLKGDSTVFKSPSKFDTHLLTHYSRDEESESTLSSPETEPGPVVWKCDTLLLDLVIFIILRN